jgi:uncharacterized membrane protein YebE (DUF533 family)
MNSTLFKDRRTAGLLNRVRQDVSHLREDIGDLLNHTTRETLPNGAHDLANEARRQLAAGGAYAATRLRSLRSTPPRESAGWIGGAVIVGLLAYGAYTLYNNGCCSRKAAEADELEDEMPG